MKKFALCLFYVFELGLLISQVALAKDSTSFDPNDVAISANESSVPVGTIAIWSTSSALPDGWLECNGQAISTSYTELRALVGTTTPNYQGMFLRGYGTQYHYQSNGSTIGNSWTTHSSGSLGFVQGDATRDIYGEFIAQDDNADNYSTFGSFYVIGTGPGNVGGGSSWTESIGFSSSRIVPTATENRPVNMAVRYIIKAN